MEKLKNRPASLVSIFLVDGEVEIASANTDLLGFQGCKLETATAHRESV